MQKLIFVCLLLAVMIGCASDDETTIESSETILYVSAEPCSSGQQFDCLLVRESLTEEWRAFREKITGFDYAPGYSYKIAIKQAPESDQWRLVDVLSRVGKFESRATKEAAQRRQVWRLDYMVTNALSLDTEITLAFADDVIVGSAGCNQYRAEYAARGANELQIEDIGASQQFCNDTVQQQERDYFDSLAMVASYEQVDATTLIFQDAQGTPILAFVTNR